jgi:hypothetical protein
VAVNEALIFWSISDEEKSFITPATVFFFFTDK